jgi:hypothetical protein
LESKDALQSISLRTMLNFNRTFEQEMLYKEESIFADDIFNNNGERVPPKTIEDSVSSFLNMLEKNLRTDIENNPEFREAISERAKTEAENRFPVQFMKKYHLNLRTGEPLTVQQIAELDNK